MKFPRRSGILLHVTSLPGPYGIGDLGEEAYRFIDFLTAAGQKLWQVLPLNPTGCGNSPYASPSAFAGNPLLISLEKLVEEGLLSIDDLPEKKGFQSDRVDYQKVAQFKPELLSKAWKIFQARSIGEEGRKFEEFCVKHDYWLDDYALFISIKEHFKERAWFDWPQKIAFRNPTLIKQWQKKRAEKIEKIKFLQYLFFKQWQELRQYANRRGIKIIGDVPFFVSHDSVDIWVNRDLFLLDRKGRRTALSGVPPTGYFGISQIWGNPLYNWEEMAKDDFYWWRQRFATILELVDIVRVDHFSGFYACWHISLGAKTSTEGHWVYSPGASLFRSIEEKLGELPIIAEALEPATFPQVKVLLEELGFASVRGLQFAFFGGPNNPHLPEDYQENCVAYTGTHDNDTCVGWFRTLAPEIKERVLQYLGTNNAREINWKLIRTVLASVADTSIIPLQDILGLGSEARMNTPGQETGQWEWRYRREMLTKRLSSHLDRLTSQSGR